MDFPVVLKKLLEEQSVKKAELGRRTGITDASISRYVSGKEQPTLTNAVKIADALGVSLDLLAGRDPERYRYPTRRQQRINDLYEAMSAEGQEETEKIVDALSMKYKKESHKPEQIQKAS
jgi:transcriptional regulator with XRE-family HTH domain